MQKAEQSGPDAGGVGRGHGSARKGISVVMNLEGLQKIHIAPESIACHVRRYLDSLELLSLTVRMVAARGAVYMTPEDAEQLYKTIVWQYGHPCEHQMIPRTLLDFMT